MKGDFSSLRFDARDNYQGVLLQQGRVMLDADLTEGELIGLHWRKQAAQDVIGAGVAAVPVADVDGFRIDAAHVVGGHVQLDVRPGRIWADGVLVYLPENPAHPGLPVPRTADYFPAPINTGNPAVGSIGDDTHDLVVLEVVLQELNGFQDPLRLKEPALGDADTAERIVARLRFGLVRLAAGQDCSTFSITEPPADQGHLTVSLDPPETVTGECPTVAGGGYTGFEHNLYRIEIADVSSGAPRFKWSQFNGGLVGLGTFQAGTPDKLKLTGNRAAIVTSGITDFYLEVLAYDQAAGYWSVVYGTAATLNSDFDLELNASPVFNAFTFGTDPVFFRLWNGIGLVGDYTDFTTPTELRDGIHLAFDPTASASYRPGDFWTFTVRAGEIVNPEVLLDDAAPQGPVYHRVPLAEIDWTAAQDTDEGGTIDDCRRRFRPLTNQRVCCSLLVGDGVHTHGDFDSLEEAATHLPADGGELCLLPGTHYANLTLQGRQDVCITGCPHRTLVLPHQATSDQPILAISDCERIAIRGLDLVSVFGPAIVAEGTNPGDLKELVIRDCRVIARDNAVRVNHGEDVVIAQNRLWLYDTSDGRATIRLRATGALVERNTLGVWPAQMTPGGGTQGGGTPAGTTPTDPCAQPENTYANIVYVTGYAEYAWGTAVVAQPAQPYQAWGGIHLLGGCERVRILENQIDGGAGHGVTLGGLLPGEQPASGTNPDPGTTPTVTLSASWPFVAYLLDESNNAVAGVDVYLMQGTTAAAQGQSDASGQVSISASAGSYTVALGPGYAIESMSVVTLGAGNFYILTVKQIPVTVAEDEAFLYQVTIEENDIRRMALSGIGFQRFDDTPAAFPQVDLNDPQAAATLLAAGFAPRELIGTCNVVRDLLVVGNRIHDNLQAAFDQALHTAVRTVGLGGISLALVETGVIAENTIIDNGTSAVHPTCGIFVGYAEDLDIRDNRIAGNGPLTQDYETEKEEGLRGGIFVRLASALLVGGAADALQKPALRIAHNYVDQPAGRAITAFAFGPVSCEGNYLNSEATGKWSVFDMVAGGVLIVNVGGIQRQTRITGSFNTVRSFGGGMYKVGGNVIGKNYAAGSVQAADVLLPGGEVLFNSNQLRLGPGHLSILATLIVTLDDLGLDGNQSVVLRPDLLFTNAFCLAFSLRATDNRFRERTQQAFFSLLTYTFGLNAQAALVAMNTTSYNQGDHCIVALTAAGTGGLPVVDDGNLEADPRCRALRKDPAAAQAAVFRALYTVLLNQAAGTQLNAAGVNATTQQSAVYAVGSVQGLTTQYRKVQLQEQARLQQRFGADNPRVLQMSRQLSNSQDTLNELSVQTQLASINEATAPQDGTLVDGRVTDAGARGQDAATVELVRRDGTPLGVDTTTDASGYYALPLNPQQTQQLAAEPAVYLQVKDASGNVVQRSAQPVQIAAGTPVRTQVVLSAARVPESAFAGGTVVFRQPGTSTGGGPATTSTPLEEVRGIGPKTAAKLRAAGIADVEALLRTPSARLVEIAGYDAHAMRREAERMTSAAAAPRAEAAPAEAPRATTAPPAPEAAEIAETPPAPEKPKPPRKPRGGGGSKGGTSRRKPRRK